MHAFLYIHAIYLSYIIIHCDKIKHMLIYDRFRPHNYVYNILK